MWDVFLRKVKLVVTDETLRTRVLFVLAALVVFRLLAAIPVPGVDLGRIQAALADSPFLALFNVFSGGGFSSFSIVMLGVGPYITASIIMQLMTILIPRLKEMYQEEGDAGRQRF